jgi:hypothetical protein
VSCARKTELMISLIKDGLPQDPNLY